MIRPIQLLVEHRLVIITWPLLGLQIIKSGAFRFPHTRVNKDNTKNCRWEANVAVVLHIQSSKESDQALFTCFNHIVCYLRTE